MNDMPSILYRWLNNKQAHDLVQGKDMIATWEHLMPDTGCMERGLSFGEDPWTWQIDGEYSVCIAISTEGLSDDLRPLFIRGDQVFNETNAYKLVVKDIENSKDEIKQQELIAKRDRIILRLCVAHLQPSDPEGFVKDEWFLRGDIPNAHAHVIGMVVCGHASARVRRLIKDLEHSNDLSFPVARIKYIDEGHGVQSQMQPAFARLGIGEWADNPQGLEDEDENEDKYKFSDSLRI